MTRDPFDDKRSSGRSSARPSSRGSLASSAPSSARGASVLSAPSASGPRKAARERPMATAYEGDDFDSPNLLDAPAGGRGKRAGSDASRAVDGGAAGAAARGTGPVRGARPAAPADGQRQKHGLPREVRIIGGQWKRSKLPVADRPGLRPSPDRVRETLFNWLGQDLTGWRCLDAFAGTGALGFEAASRGAAEVVLVERDAQLAIGLRAVQERLKASAVRIDTADALTWMSRKGNAQFDLVFLDAPFESDLALPALKAATRLLVPDGLAYFESDAAVTEEMLEALGLSVFKSQRAGAVHFALLRRDAIAPAATIPATSDASAGSSD
jgi:16S rRNA (guanine(966)-N(2))-methyltransferase RsmD